MQSSDIAIDPGKGWGNFRLGDTISEVLTKLDSTDRPYEQHSDGYVIDIEHPQVTFYFDDESPKRLRQMVFYDQGHLVDGQNVIGLTLAEGLLPFRVRSYEDGLWSMVSIEEEFPTGKALLDSKRIRRASAEEKLNFGTLWVKSQGVGIVMLYGDVHAIALRRVGDTPSVGSGQLSAQEMTLALAEKELPAREHPVRDIGKSRTIEPQRSSPSLRKSPTARTVLLLSVALLLLAIPGLVVYRDFTRWDHAKDVVGNVVQTTPEGPFPDQITIEYTPQDSGVHRIVVPSQYTTARELGQSVELLYLPDSPDYAVTKTQANVLELSVPPYLLVGSFMAGLYLISLCTKVVSQH
jgi:hypothetical protein